MGKTIELVACVEVPEYTGLKNTKEIEVRDGCEWNGHACSTLVGMILDDGTVESHFKKDIENGNTEIFDRLRNDIQMIEKHVNLYNLETNQERCGRRYYIPYKVKNHCSDRPTVTDSCVDRVSNVHYSVEYEILLVADEDYKRYITVEFETEGSFASTFFDQIGNIEDMFEEWFEECSHGFSVDEDYSDYKTVRFYDETGEHCDIEISSIRELLSMIASIRVIKCDRKIIK